MKTLATLIALGLSAAVQAAAQAPLTAAPEQALAEQPVLVSQYNAVLSTSAGRWQLFDATGPRLQFEANGCRSSPLLPPGLWLLTRDAEGAPVLVAPSSTALPAGHPGRIAVLPCGSLRESRDAAEHLQLPEALVATLEQNASAILIAR
ncbi:MAG TPA: hypothetical protein VFY12_00045 [Arenimonas sp.]|nr:hypothetical protein [Arenimonas sp.]